MRGAVLALTAVLAGCATHPAADEPVVVYAAGSLRDALSDVAREHEVRTGQKISLTFGPSGLLRERIEKGEGAQVFASADTQHPQRLSAGGGWAAPTVFVRNSLCALVRPGLTVTPDNMLDTLLRPDLKLGMSTPKADPAGDYAVTLFQKAGAMRAGAHETLTRKALQLTGGPASAVAPAGRNTYAWVMEQGQADVFLTYCTNAVAARKERDALQVVSMPAALQVGAAYGTTTRQGAPAQAVAFGKAMLSEPAQSILARYGFGRP